MKDGRGINRGKCKKCTGCTDYNLPQEGSKCVDCGCPPGKHQNLDSAPTQAAPHWSDCIGQLSLSQDVAWAVPQTMSSPSQASRCSVPSCSKTVGFDVNTGEEYMFCKDHLKVGSAAALLQVEDIESVTDPYAVAYAQDHTMSLQTSQSLYYDGSDGSDMIASLPMDQAGLPQSMMLPPPGGNICAIQECSNPCYVDDSGTVHECCGYTHAMEHQRRQALWQQVNQKVVKGVTHCLLPGCTRPTWPFHNYCGKTHAQQGQQMGLSPPSLSTYSAQPAITSGSKDSTMCIIPECFKKKFVDTANSVTHDYCGRSHAEEGKRRGIQPTADTAEEQCELPGCTNRKRTEGPRVHDYCCLDHAQQDVPNKDARILTSDSQVRSFLSKFPNLTIDDENDYAKPGGALFQRFKQAYNSLPKHQRRTCLAFHGTAAANIDSICQNGYDPGRRRGQALGPGEYFAVSPGTPMGYCCAGKKMLLNELLLGQSGVHHTQHGDIIVMKNPDHDLPRYVITFK